MTYLEKLKFSFNQLENSLGFLSEFAFSLVQLDVSFNELAEVNRNDFCMGSKLNYLFLNNNKLKYVRNFTFENLAESLLSLNLDNNLIQVIEPMCFNGLKALNSLSIRNNLIKSVLSSTFVSFDSCKILMTRNNISLMEPNAFKYKSNVSFDYQLLIGDRFTHGCFSFEFLDLSQQNTQAIYKNSLKGLFKKLHIENNIISKFETDAFDYMPYLNELSLAKNLIRSLDFNDAFKYN